MTQDALILFAHGSRDPLWCKPIEAVAERAQARAPRLVVRCAYLELTQPSLDQVAAQLAATGVVRVGIRPMFLGVGKHAREDFPRLLTQLRTQYPQMQWTLAPSVGEENAVLDALADVVLSKA